MLEGDVLEGDVLEGDVLEGDVLEGDVLEGDVLEGDVLEGDVLDVLEGDVLDVLEGDVLDVREGDGERRPGRIVERRKGGSGARVVAAGDPQDRTDLELFLDAGRVLDVLMDEHGLTNDVFAKLQRLYPRPRVYAGWLSFARASSVDAEHRQLIRRMDRCLRRRRDGASWDEVLAELADEEAVRDPAS